jgi:cell filamentation protein
MGCPVDSDDRYDTAGNIEAEHESGTNVLRNRPGITVQEETVLRRETPCAGKSLEATARSITIVQAEFLLIHPFRDGNGRLIRLASTLMALQAGFPPMDYEFEAPAQRERYIAAVRRGYVQDYAPLEMIVREAIRRGEGT